jgi:hypothetical protein
MLKKIVLAGAIAIASLVSFNLGSRMPSVSVPAPAKACGPFGSSCPYYSCC